MSTRTGSPALSSRRVAHMDFRRENRLSARRHIVRPDPDQLVGLVDGAVEQHVIVRHVEMAVVVDPLRFDPA